jgi:hypothetical protein
MPIIVLQKLPLVKCFCITFIIIFVCQGRAVVSEAKGQNQQGQAKNYITVAQAPTLSVQPITEQPKTTETGRGANDKTEITIKDTRSSVLEWAAIVLNFLLLLVVGYQAYTYKQQLQVMREERGVVSEQATAMQDGLAETRKIVAQNERVVSAMEIQAKAAQDAVEAAELSIEFTKQNAIFTQLETQESLAETRKMVKLNARAVEASEAQAVASQASVKATEESVEVARKAFYVGERAYFGIKEMKIGLIGERVKPVITITYLNGGRTPAWHFEAWFVGLSIGKHPSKQGIWTIQEHVSDISNSFVPAGKEITIVYAKNDRLFTKEEVDTIKSSSLRLFLVGTAHYTDISGEKQEFHFCGVYDRESGKFGDYYAG